MILGQDYKAFHCGHGHHRPFNKNYKHRGYAAQDYEVDETFDPNDVDGYSEWADDGAYCGDDGTEAGYEDWDEASTFDANAAYSSTSMRRMPQPTANGRTSMCMTRPTLHTSTRESASLTFASPEGTCRLSHWAILQLVTSALASLHRPRALRP